MHEVKLTVLRWSLQLLAVSLPQQKNSVQSLGNHRFIYFISLLIFLFHSVTEKYPPYFYSAVTERKALSKMALIKGEQSVTTKLLAAHFCFSWLFLGIA